MFFAKTSKGASRASEDMRTNNFYKGYFALSEGTLPEKSGFLENRLLKNSSSNTVSESENGKPSLLYYRFLCASREGNIYFAVPVTGRTHQIRAQFSIAGAPLAGDVKYGGSRQADNFLGLWSYIASVRKTVDRSARIWARSLPGDSRWFSENGGLPDELEQFLTDDVSAEKFFIELKEETRFGKQ